MPAADPDMSLRKPFFTSRCMMRHADAGYKAAIACARRNGLQLPMLKA
jgi:urocanate hydratase